MSWIFELIQQEYRTYEPLWTPGIVPKLKFRHHVKLIFHLSKDRNDSSLLVQHYKALTHYINGEYLILSLIGLPKVMFQKFSASKNTHINWLIYLLSPLPDQICIEHTLGEKQYIMCFLKHNPNVRRDMLPNSQLLRHSKI